MEDKFVVVWKRRDEIQPILIKNLIDEWAKGRNQFLTFLIRVGDKELIERIVEVQNRLSNVPCINPFPKDYFHITVKGCGFLGKSRKYDDILLGSLKKIMRQAEEVLQPFSKFNVSLAKLNIFSEVVFIEVHDEGEIGELNKALQVI